MELRVSSVLCLHAVASHGLLPSRRQGIHSSYAQAPGYRHLHLISDATGETLITVACAAAAHEVQVQPVEHVHPLVRTQKQLDRALADLEESPGIVLYTLLEENLVERLETKCRDLGLPCLSILGPVLHLFQAYLARRKPRSKPAQPHHP